MCNSRSCKYGLNAPDDERKYRSKHVEQLGIINYPTQLHLVGYFNKLYHDARKHEYQVYLTFLLVWRNR
jgi:hypothetical protein